VSSRAEGTGAVLPKVPPLAAIEVWVTKKRSTDSAATASVGGSSTWTDPVVGSLGALGAARVADVALSASARDRLTEADGHRSIKSNA